MCDGCVPAGIWPLEWEGQPLEFFSLEASLVPSGRNERQENFIRHSDMELACVRVVPATGRCNDPYCATVSGPQDREVTVWDAVMAGRQRLIALTSIATGRSWSLCVEMS